MGFVIDVLMLPSLEPNVIYLFSVMNSYFVQMNCGGKLFKINVKVCFLLILTMFILVTLHSGEIIHIIANSPIIEELEEHEDINNDVSSRELIVGEDDEINSTAVSTRTVMNSGDIEELEISTFKSKITEEIQPTLDIEKDDDDIEYLQSEEF